MNCDPVGRAVDFNWFRYAVTKFNPQPLSLSIDSVIQEVALFTPKLLGMRTEGYPTECRANCIWYLRRSTAMLQCKHSVREFLLGLYIFLLQYVCQWHKTVICTPKY